MNLSPPQLSAEAVRGDVRRNGRHVPQLDRLQRNPGVIACLALIWCAEPLSRHQLASGWHAMLTRAARQGAHDTDTQTDLVTSVPGCGPSHQAASEADRTLGRRTEAQTLKRGATCRAPCRRRHGGLEARIILFGVITLCACCMARHFCGGSQAVDGGVPVVG